MKLTASVGNVNDIYLEDVLKQVKISIYFDTDSLASMQLC